MHMDITGHEIEGVGCAACDRRQFFRRGALSVGSVALASLLHNDTFAARKPSACLGHLAGAPAAAVLAARNGAHAHFDKAAQLLKGRRAGDDLLGFSTWIGDAFVAVDDAPFGEVPD